MTDTGPTKAAGVICKSPQGRILMCRRVDDGTWAFPGGRLKDGETAEQAAWREFFEETGYRLGDVGKFLMRRNKDGVDFVTFIADVEAEFVPKLNHEHSAYGWFEPNGVLEEAA
jgi:8-oxo-dGTP pyrophosphatase MutT (NUDIX family)